MEPQMIMLFTLTVLPLICTPGPDMIFVTSQALSGGAAAGLRATFGICLGYGVHSGLVAAGLAAIIAASPILFEALRWVGILYLLYLASTLIRSALGHTKAGAATVTSARQIRRGFLTSVLNPKGMMIYFAILPQFIIDRASVAWHAVLLSLVFIAWCGIVYAALSLVLGRIRTLGAIDNRRRRIVEGSGGGLLMIAAAAMAVLG